MKKLLLLLSVLFVVSCSSDTEELAPVIEYTLTTSVNPSTGGTITPASGQHIEGSIVELTAIPNVKWEFKEWAGDITGTDNPKEIIWNNSKTITAIFEEQSPFYLDENEVTIKARDWVSAGTTGELDGVTYTAVDIDKLKLMFTKEEDVSKVVTTLITDMSDLFENAPIEERAYQTWLVEFNPDISSWDVSNVTNMSNMVGGAWREFHFNQDISKWDVSKVTNMSGMFNNAFLFNQDIIAAKGQFLPGAGLSFSQNLNLGNVELFEGSFIDRTFHSSNVGINLSQTVFNGFRNINTYKQSLVNREASVLELSRIKDDVSLNVVNAYLNVLFNKENLQTAKTQVKFSKNQIIQVSALVEAGIQPQANIFDAEATFSSDEQRFTVAQNNYDLALLTLSQLLQVPYKGFHVESLLIANPSEELIYSNVEMVLDFALSNRTEIKIAEKNREAAALSTEISKSGYYPSVSFGYGFNTGANFSNLSKSNSFFQQINDNRGHGFNLNISVPLFSRFQNKTAVAKSKVQEKNAKLNLDKTRLDLESNIQRAYTDAQAALKTFVASNKSLKARKLSLNNAKERYEIGALNAFELDQNRVQLVNAEANLINAKFDFVFKTKVLAFYMGNKIVE